MKPTMSHHDNMTNIDAEDKTSSSLYKQGVYMKYGSPVCDDDDETSIFEVTDSFDDESFEDTIDFEKFAPSSVDVAYGDDGDTNALICRGNSVATFAKKRRVWVMRRRRFLYCFLGTIVLAWIAFGLHSLITSRQREKCNQLGLGGALNHCQKYENSPTDSSTAKSHISETAKSHISETAKSHHAAATKESGQLILGVESNNSKDNYASSRDPATTSTAYKGVVGDR